MKRRRKTECDVFNNKPDKRKVKKQKTNKKQYRKKY